MIVVSVNSHGYQFTVDENLKIKNGVSDKDSTHIEVTNNLGVGIYCKLLKMFHPDLAPQYGTLGKLLTQKIHKAKTDLASSTASEPNLHKATIELSEIMERIFSDFTMNSAGQKANNQPKPSTELVTEPDKEIGEAEPRFDLAGWLYNTGKGRIPKDKFIATLKAAYQVAQQEGITAQFVGVNQYPRFPSSVWEEAYSQSSLDS